MGTVVRQRPADAGQWRVPDLSCQNVRRHAGGIGGRDRDWRFSVAGRRRLAGQRGLDAGGAIVGMVAAPKAPRQAGACCRAGISASIGLFAQIGSTPDQRTT